MTKSGKIIMWSSIGLAIGVTAYFLFRKKDSSLKKFLLPHKKPTRFLFVGDSTTAYESSFADKLKKLHPEFTVKKIAMVGAKTDWMLPQLQAELKNNKYDVVTILAGSNDIFATLSIDNAKKNLQAMYDMASKNGAKVVAISMPNKKFYDKTTPKHLALIASLVDWIKHNKSINYFIDLGNLITERSGFGSDGQHISAKSHEVLEKEFEKKVL